MAAEKEKFCISHDLLGGVLSDLGAGSIAELMEKSEKEKAMRNKLAELLEKAEGMVNNDRPSLEQIADCLVANGVTIPVRCKDCRFCLFNECNETFKCRTMKGLYRTVEPDEHCSYGERRTDGAEG